MNNIYVRNGIEVTKKCKLVKKRKDNIMRLVNI